MEQVHLYRAGTNGRPVQQSYTLTGSASIGPPTGKHQGKGPEPTTRTPPHPPQPGRPGHGTRGTPPQATRKRDRRRRAHKGSGGGTHHQQTPARGGRGTTQPRRERGHDTQPPHPHRAAKPSPERRGQAPKRTTNTPHTRPRMHTTHIPTTATDTSPTNAHHTPKRKRRPHHKRNTRKPKKQEPSNPPPGELQGRRKHR